jgi:hypothetical protein
LPKADSTIKPEANWYNNFTLIRIPIRGIANSELVYVLRKEHRGVSKEQQRDWKVESWVSYRVASVNETVKYSANKEINHAEIYEEYRQGLDEG